MRYKESSMRHMNLLGADKMVVNELNGEGIFNGTDTVGINIGRKVDFAWFLRNLRGQGIGTHG